MLRHKSTVKKMAITGIIGFIMYWIILGSIIFGGGYLVYHVTTTIVETGVKQSVIEAGCEIKDIVNAVSKHKSKE